MSDPTSKTFQRDMMPLVSQAPDHIDQFANNVAVASFENGGNNTFTFYFSRERLALPANEDPDAVKLLRTEFAAISMTKTTAMSLLAALQSTLSRE